MPNRAGSGSKNGMGAFPASPRVLIPVSSQCLCCTLGHSVRAPPSWQAGAADQQDTHHRLSGVPLAPQYPLQPVLAVHAPPVNSQSTIIMANRAGRISEEGISANTTSVHFCVPPSRLVTRCLVESAQRVQRNGDSAHDKAVRLVHHQPKG